MKFLSIDFPANHPDGIPVIVRLYLKRSTYQDQELFLASSFVSVKFHHLLRQVRPGNRARFRR